MGKFSYGGRRLRIREVGREGGEVEVRNKKVFPSNTCLATHLASPLIKSWRRHCLQLWRNS